MLFRIKNLLKNLGVEIRRTNPRYLRIKETDKDVTVFGKSVVFHDFNSFNLCHQEIIEDECYKFISRSSKPIIIDCGANFGMAVRYFKKIYPEAEIHAFEADPDIFKYLEQNSAIARHQNVFLYNSAVWFEQSQLYFKSNKGAGGKLVENDSDSTTIKVDAIDMNKFLSKFDRIDFLKIDIEGAENDVIPHIKHQLSKVDNLFVEYHSFENKPQHLSDLLNVIEGAGFRYYIKEASFVSHPFVDEKINHGMDLQLNIFAKNTRAEIGV